MLSSSAIDRAGQARSSLSSYLKTSPLRPSQRRAHVSADRGSLLICKHNFGTSQENLFEHFGMRKRHLVLSKGVTDAIVGFVEMTRNLSKRKNYTLFAHVCVKAFIQLLQPPTFPRTSTVKILLMFRVVKSFHFVRLHLSDALAANKASGFLIVFAIAKK